MPPVEDHPVHELTVRHAGYRASCHNRAPFAEGYLAKDGDGVVWIEHTMSTKCRQTTDLPECKGCTAPKDTAYIEKWKNDNGEVRGASRLAGEASSAEGATSTVVLEGGKENGDVR